MAEEIQPLSTAPPVILATSTLTRISPRHAATAALSSAKQLDRQLGHAEMRAQYRRVLPVTQLEFYQKRQKPSPNK